MTLSEAVIVDAHFTDIETIAIKKLNAQIMALKNYFKERDDIIEAMVVTLLSKQHLVMVGPPGTAKSYLIESFCSGFEQFELFNWQFTKFTTPEEVFGPYSLKALKEGIYKRITAHKLPEADLAYLDEIFNANSSILNALNSAMNERVFERAKIKLNSVFSGTNFIPEESVLVAFFDRFLFRFIVDEIMEADHFEQMLLLNSYHLDPDLILSKTELEALQIRLSTVKYDSIVKPLTKVREVLKEEAIYPSSRRFKWAIQALQANALLYGRNEVIDEDLFILKNILWQSKTEIAKIEQIILKTISPALSQIRELLSMAQDLDKQSKALDAKKPDELGQIMENSAKLQEIIEDLADILKNKNLQSKVKEVAEKIIGQIQTIRKTLINTKLGFAL